MARIFSPREGNAASEAELGQLEADRLVAASSDAEEAGRPMRRRTLVYTLGSAMIATLGVAGWATWPSNKSDPVAQFEPAPVVTTHTMRDDDLISLDDDDKKEKPLFERLGGAYAIAAVADSFLNKIMVDDVLEANKRIKAAHDPKEVAGFKYLVWEIVNQATGGPTKYTGRDIKAVHWHLKITSKQWDAFAGDFKDSLDEFKVPQKEQTELFNIMGPLKKQCVNEHDDNPADPPAMDLPDGTLYKELGGIYPIATMVDYVVDKVNADKELNKNDAIVKTTKKFPVAGHKFLVTQFMGMATGGPQKYTGKSMKDAHKGLGITAAEWKHFAGIFTDALDHFKVPEKLQKDLVKLMGKVEKDIVQDEL